MDRQHDIAMLEQELSRPGLSRAAKEKIRCQIQRLSRPVGPKVADMRRQLIAAHQKNNLAEIEDIRDFVGKHPDYQ